MDTAVMLLGLCSCVTLITIFVGCIKCKKKVITEEEKQQRYFEKFRKKHMLPRDHVLTNRVDVIRHNSTLSTDKSESACSSISDHSYDDMVVPQPVIVPEVAKSEHSFFDDSFQTVIEASSYMTAGNGSSSCIPGNQTNLLTVPDHLNSYISLRRNSSIVEMMDETNNRIQGEENAAFLGDSFFHDQPDCPPSFTDLNGSYLIPKSGPQIIVVQPSIRRLTSSEFIGISEFATRNNLQATNTLKTTNNLQATNNLQTANTLKTTNSLQTLNNREDRNNEVNSLNNLNLETRVSDLPSLNTVVNVSCNDLSEATDQIVRQGDKIINEGETALAQNVNICINNQRDTVLNQLELDQNKSLSAIRQQRLEIEGRTQYHSNRDVVQNYEHDKFKANCSHPKVAVKSGSYDNLKDSDIDNSPYSRLKSLSIPRIKIRMPKSSFDTRQRHKTASAGSQQSDHTYDSLTSELFCEMRRPDVTELAEGDFSNCLSPAANKHVTINVENSEYPFRTPCVSRVRHGDINENNVASTSEENNTYESIKSGDLQKSNHLKPSDNAVVIIGRRISNPWSTSGFGSNKKVKHPATRIKSGHFLANQSGKSKKESEDRYSPFPSAKKLAIKTFFKQTASPRFSMMQTLSENLNQSLHKKSPRLPPRPAVPLTLTLDNINLQTPEIKVDNKDHCLTLNSKIFVSPKIQNIEKKKTRTKGLENAEQISFISPMCTYQTLKDCVNLKTGLQTLQNDADCHPKNPRPSLPSLADDLGQEIHDYCNNNWHAQSTPSLETQKNMPGVF